MEIHIAYICYIYYTIVFDPNIQIHKMSEYEEYQEGMGEEEEDGNTTTVQFIAVSADEHERMIREGELPASIQVIDKFNSCLDLTTLSNYAQSN